MTTLEIDDDRRQSAGRRHEDDAAQPIGKWLGFVVLAISIVGSEFGVGYNWRSVALLEGQQENFVRKDVQGEQLKNVYSKLDEIMRQLAEMREERARAR